MAAESISRLLGDNAELRPLSERLLYIKRLQKRYRTLAPEKLAEASRVCAIEGTTVVIRASSGAVAAALRHVAPRLLQGLAMPKTSKHSRDQELTAIRIEVQVDVPTPKVVAKPRGDFPRAKLGSFAEQMSDSPLKDELMRIGAQSKSTRSKT